MSKHTPGPWKASVGGLAPEVLAPGSTCPVVGWTGFDDSFRDKSEHEANARLIAAAPKLLESCKAADAVLDSCAVRGIGEHLPPMLKDLWDQAHEEIRTAIAQAEGESK